MCGHFAEADQTNRGLRLVAQAALPDVHAEMFTLVLGKSFRCVQSEFPERFDFRVSDSRILFPYHVQPDELYRRTTVSCPNLFHE